jgi:hypothetical protein
VHNSTTAKPRGARARRWLLMLLVPVYTACSATWLNVSGELRTGDWRDARPVAAGLAPDPGTTPEAVIQVYAARAVRWRGYFGVHTWIAVKRTGEDRYTVYEINGHRLRRTGTALVTSHRMPDGAWFGNPAELVAQQRGPGVDELIDRVEDAVAAYPYATRYRVWPGPNSNTFTAFVLRAVPELRADLPPTAIGKDYLGMAPLARLPSGTGAQFNVLGVAGLALGLEEGLELNLLGLTFGIDPGAPGIKLPLVGRLPRPPRGEDAT